MRKGLTSRWIMWPESFTQFYWCCVRLD